MDYSSLEFRRFFCQNLSMILTRTFNALIKQQVVSGSQKKGITLAFCSVHHTSFDSLAYSKMLSLVKQLHRFSFTFMNILDPFHPQNCLQLSWQRFSTIPGTLLWHVGPCLPIASQSRWKFTSSSSTSSWYIVLNLELVYNIRLCCWKQIPVLCSQRNGLGQQQQCWFGLVAKNTPTIIM